MVQGESPKEQKELLIKARLMTQMVEEERTWIFGYSVREIIYGMGACLLKNGPVWKRRKRQIYALNDPKLCICVFYIQSTDIPGTTDVDDICLDSIEGDTIELIIAKSEVEVLYRQWRLVTSGIHQDSPAYTE